LQAITALKTSISLWVKLRIYCFSPHNFLEYSRHVLALDGIV
jgi:hypothetical protein